MAVRTVAACSDVDSNEAADMEQEIAAQRISSGRLHGTSCVMTNCPKSYLRYR